MGMQEISMMFVKPYQWDNSIPVAEFTENKFLPDLAGDRDMTTPLTVAFVSGEEMSHGESSHSGVSFNFFPLLGDVDGD